MRVDGSELHLLNVWLYEAQQVIGAQVHSHPVEAFHSEIDDTYPIATLDGSLSIVLPSFGRSGFGSKDIARLPPRPRRMARTNRSPKRRDGGCRRWR